MGILRNKKIKKFALGIALILTLTTVAMRKHVEANLTALALRSEMVKSKSEKHLFDKKKFTGENVFMTEGKDKEIHNAWLQLLLDVYKRYPNFYNESILDEDKANDGEETQIRDSWSW